MIAFLYRMDIELANFFNRAIMFSRDISPAGNLVESA
ncbi:hypothetical protein HMPREF1654_00325 [Streptococcus intermedius SK54 = ATCC 27335]|nr:hypothetical protein HMPREF1654_00325 [Streptococcus intermedius SK54 = ATCC 27335]